MKLQELLKDVAVKNSTAAQDIEIKEVRYDSRAVQPGDLFVAIRGYATDGHKYIAKAMEQGAAAVVCEEAGREHGHARCDRHQRQDHHDLPRQAHA